LPVRARSRPSFGKKFWPNCATKAEATRPHWQYAAERLCLCAETRLESIG
jgi:hypothetical protein